MKPTNPLLKGRRTKTMKPRILQLLGQYHRLMLAERRVRAYMQAAVDDIIYYRLKATKNNGVGWHTEIDPAELHVGIRFTIDARNWGDRKHDPSQADINRAHAMYRRLGRTVIPAVRRAVGAKVGYEVGVD